MQATEPTPDRIKENCPCNQLSSVGVPQQEINKLIQKRREKIDYQDIVQIIIGSFAAAIVFAPTNELISISQKLPVHKLSIIFIFSLAFIGLLAYGFGGRNLHIKDIQTIAKIIPVRLVLIFLISTISCLIALWIYDIITIETSPLVVIRRVVVLLLPATWGGALIDLLHSKNK
jgi:uncharacterized membrane protein